MNNIVLKEKKIKKIGPYMQHLEKSYIVKGIALFIIK